MSKYGCLNPLQSEEIRLKVKRTCLKRYGVENYTQTTEYKNKSTETNVRKYGVKYYAQSIKFHKSARKQFRYLENTFDSFPELCLFIYAKTNGIPIKRAPVSFHFIFGGIDHWYIPDFEINGELIEIKGDHFVGEDGTWRCPFDHSKDALFEEKHQCALKNNVRILYKKDYQKYIDWFYKNGYKKSDYITTKGDIR